MIILRNIIIAAIFIVYGITSYIHNRFRVGILQRILTRFFKIKEMNKSRAVALLVTEDMIVSIVFVYFYMKFQGLI